MAAFLLALTFSQQAQAQNLSINDVVVNENAGTAVFTVSLSAPAGSGGVRFDIGTANGTAIAVSDYTPKTLNNERILAGNSTYTFTVNLVDDAAFEQSETFSVSVTNVTGATIIDGVGVGTILDNDPASTTTAVTASPNPSVTGQGVTLTATVTPQSGAGTPTGSVTFTGPNGLNQTVALNGAGQAGLTTAALTSGTVTATYSGATGFNSSAGTVGVAVNPASTTTAVTASPNPSVTGQGVTLTATITPQSGAGTPTGSVTFTGPNGLNQTVALNGAGEAGLTTAALTSGTVTATYSGATGFNPSSGTVGVAVNPASTTTAVTASPNPSVTGQSVTLTATITPQSGAGTPTGSVTFTGPNGLNQTVALNGAGEAGLTTAALTSGTVTATYSGATGFNSSAGTVEVTVNPPGNANTTTTVTASPNPSVTGQGVTLTATITPQSGANTPTGSVTFTGPNGLNQTVALNGAGQASLTTAALTSGTVTATYSGATGFNSSAGTVEITVNPPGNANPNANTTTAVNASPNPSVTGQSVTLTATITPQSGANTPTGSVTFTGPNGLNQTVALNGAGQASLTTAALTSGTVTATYSGATGFNSSAGTVEITVNPPGNANPNANTTTAVTAAPNPSVTGQGVTLTATITPQSGAGTPTGSVTFTGPNGLNQTVALNGAGQASLTTAALTSGTVTATYSGATGFNSSAGTVEVTVEGTVEGTVGFARPDASLNPEVTGLLDAQTGAATGLATTQIRNFLHRLEGLHSEGQRRESSFDVRLGFTRNKNTNAAERQIDKMIADSHTAVAAPHGAAPNVLTYSSQETPAPPNYLGPDLGPFAVWSAGFINFGENDEGGLDLDHMTAGGSIGIDLRFSKNFVGGFGIGYGWGRTGIGGNGSENRAKTASAALYASYQPIEGLFVDGMIGGGWLSFDSKRFLTADGQFATGTRDGAQVFGSLAASYEFRDKHWLISPYGRVEFSRTWLGGFTETGGGAHALNYGDQRVDRVSGVVGMRAAYTFEMDWGELTPGGRIEYARDFEGMSQAGLGYADQGDHAYTTDADRAERDFVRLGLSLNVRLADNWNLGFDYRTSFGSHGSQDHAVDAKITARY